MSNITPTLQDDDKSDTNEMVTWRQLLFGTFIMLALPTSDLIADRANFSDKDDTKSWDKTLASLVAILGSIVMLFVAGLDMRFEWSPHLPPITP